MARPLILGTLILASACGGGDGGGKEGEPLFPEKPECEGESVVPLAGQHPVVISQLAISSADNSFDLDRDGEPDNKLAAASGLANPALQDALESFDLVIPIEFFDFENPAADECIKFAIYVGAYRQDGDGDGSETAGESGDCDDTDENVHPEATEAADNRKDDDCDGLADEGADDVPSDDDTDEDGDEVSLAGGDCDDTDENVHPEMEEVCGDGLDNDCDGNADWPGCSPYDDVLDPISLDPVSFKGDGSPVVAFTAGEVVDQSGTLELSAGPSIFSIAIPIFGDIVLELRATGVTVTGEVVMTPGGYTLVGAKLGGVIDAHSADQVRGLDVPDINLTPENSLLDAAFANALGPLLALPTLPEDHEHADEYPGCRTPDIDVDQDGLEAFCDSTGDSAVDVCIDGDGTVIPDEGGRDCTEAMDDDGDLRFVDGISLGLEFEAVPAALAGAN